MWAAALTVQVLIVAVTVLITATAVYLNNRGELRDQYGERARVVADSVAEMPATVDALRAGAPGGDLQDLVEQIRTDTGLTYIVVGDRTWTRYTHPEPERIGERVSTDPSDALAGETTVVVETGTLGETMRAKVPVYDPDTGDVIGFISAGISTAEIGDTLERSMRIVFLCGLLGLAVGVLGSWLLARRLRRDTRGLAAADIATLHEHREAMLLSLGEGVVTVDNDGRVTLVNDEARRLLGLTDQPSELLVGQDLADVVRAPELAHLSARSSGPGETIRNGDRLLVANHRPVEVDGVRVGSVITLRDRTELQQLLGELASARRVTQALRAQAHEHSNRMHTVAGLIELGRTDEALGFITGEAARPNPIDGLDDPTLQALLSTKAGAARTRGIDFQIIAAGDVATAQLAQPDDAVTAIGNLIDNAFDAVAGGANPPAVRVELAAHGTTLVASVEDSGDGVAHDARARIFEFGYSTKVGEGRGIGLALVLATALRRAGRLDVSDGVALPGARFEVRLPGMLVAREVLTS